MRPGETRKAEREGMREYDIRSELLDKSILQDRDVPHPCSCGSFEERSGEGLHVNTLYLSPCFVLRKIRVFQACVVVDKKTGGMSSRTTQNG